MGKVWGSGEQGGWARPSQAEGTARAKSRADEAAGSWQERGEVEAGGVVYGRRPVRSQAVGALGAGFRQGRAIRVPRRGLLAAWG